MPHLNEHFDSWIGRTLKDASGHKVGKVADIYTDDDTGQPEWLAVTTGHFGSNVSFVPVHGAAAEGDDLQVPFPKEQVKEAPNAGSDARLSQEEEARLYAHYGYDYDQERVRLQKWVDAERNEAHADGEGRHERGPIDANRRDELDANGHRVQAGSERGDIERGDIERGDIERGDFERGDFERGDRERDAGRRDDAAFADPRTEHVAVGSDARRR